MNLENFTQAYKSIIAESTVDSDLKAYIKTVLEDTLTEVNREPLGHNISAELSDIMAAANFKKMTDQDYMGFKKRGNNAFMTEYGDFTVIIDGNDILVIPVDAEQAGFQQKSYKIVFDSVIRE